METDYSSYDELFSLRTDGCGNLLLIVNDECVMQRQIGQEPWMDENQQTAHTAQQMVQAHLLKMAHGG